MKRLSKLLLILTLCFTFVGCSSKRTTADITKSFEEANYTVKYNKDEKNNNITVTIGKLEKNKETSQFITYFVNDKPDSVAYVKLPADATKKDDMIIGFIYADKKSESQVNDDVKKAAEKILEKFDLTIEELVEYCNDIHADDGKSLKEKK